MDKITEMKDYLDDNFRQKDHDKEGNIYEYEYHFKAGGVDFQVVIRFFYKKQAFLSVQLEMYNPLDLYQIGHYNQWQVGKTLYRWADRDFIEETEVLYHTIQNMKKIAKRLTSLS